MGIDLRRAQSLSEYGALGEGDVGLLEVAAWDQRPIGHGEEGLRQVHLGPADLIQLHGPPVVVQILLRAPMHHPQRLMGLCHPDHVVGRLEVSQGVLDEGYRQLSLASESVSTADEGRCRRDQRLVTGLVRRRQSSP